MICGSKENCTTYSHRMLNSMAYICSKIFRLVQSHLVIKYGSLDITALPESA